MTDNSPITRNDIMEEIAKLRDTLDRWRAPMEKKLDDHHVALFGNGKPGLDEEVRNINAKLNTLMRLAWIVATAAISIGVSGTIAAVVYLIKAMP